MIKSIHLLFFPEHTLPLNLRSQWRQVNKDSYLSYTNPLLIILALISVLHLLLVDLKAGFLPNWVFITVRVSIACICVVIVFFRHVVSTYKYYKLPYILVFSIIPIGQFSLIMLEPRIPFFVGLIILGLSIVAMGLSIGFSLIVLTLLYFPAIPFLIYTFPVASVPVLEQIVSNFIIAALFSCFQRSKVFRDIRIFHLNEQNIALTKQAFEAQQKSTERDVHLGRLAIQVAHDLRSPISALDAASSLYKDSPENSVILLKNSIARINEIASDLLHHAKSSFEQSIPSSTAHYINGHELSALIAEIILEIEVQFRNLNHINFSFDDCTQIEHSSIRTQPTDLKRILSIILNNSVEALTHNRNVKIKVSKQFFSKNSEEVVILVEDSGKGIPIEILKNLGKRGLSFEKPNGNGIGLSYCKSTLEAWGGRLEIISQLDKGTQVHIALPLSSPSSSSTSYPTQSK